jgi:hypothetical protein
MSLFLEGHHLGRKFVLLGIIAVTLSSTMPINAKVTTEKNVCYAIANTQKAPIKFTQLNNEKIKEFAKEKNINVLASKNVGDCTIVVYEMKYNRGSYELSLDQTGKINIRGAARWDNDSKAKPVSVDYCTLSGKYSSFAYSTIIINKCSILDKAYSVKVTYDDNEKVCGLLQHKNAVVIPYSNIDVRMKHITICTKDGKVVYNQNNLQ